MEAHCMSKNFIVISEFPILLTGDDGFTFGSDGDNRRITLPSGIIYVSGQKTSYKPNDIDMFFGYETDKDDNYKIKSYAINGEEVEKSLFDDRIMENESLKNSNFGKHTIYGLSYAVKSLLDRSESVYMEKKNKDLLMKKIDVFKETC
jgi:hypothetical protein